MTSGPGARALIVGAVSTADKTQDPEVQVVALQAEAVRKGWEVVHVLRFKQSRFDRESEKEVQESIQAALLEHNADVLMVEGLDRVARGKPRQTFRFIERLEEHHGIHFHSRREPFLSTSNEGFRDVLLQLFAYMANQESGQKSERGKQKAAYKRQAAEKLGQRALWGRGKMATEEDRRLIHDLKAQGLTVRAIKAQVGFSVGTVHRVLKEPRPTGQPAEQSEPVRGSGAQSQAPVGEVAGSKRENAGQPAGDLQDSAAQGHACWSCGTTDMAVVAPGARNFVHRAGCVKLEVPDGP